MADRTIDEQALYLLMVDRKDDSHNLNKWVSKLPPDERQKLIRWLEMQVRLVIDSLGNVIEIFEALQEGATNERVKRKNS